jgi:Phage major capsid protein E
MDHLTIDTPRLPVESVRSRNALLPRFEERDFDFDLVAPVHDRLIVWFFRIRDRRRYAVTMGWNGFLLRDKLFSKVVTTPGDLVDISFYKGKAKLAPYCSKFSAGIAVPRERQQLRLFSPSHIKVVRTLTADDVFYRSMNGAKSDSRDAELLALDLTELDNDISRREEWMVSQALFTGKIVCLDGDTNEITAEIDYTPIRSSVVSPL